LACVALLSAPSGAGGQEPDPAFVDRVMASLSVDERVGQLVMVNFVGDDVSPESDIAGLVRDFKVGAVLVTASNGNIVNRDDTAGHLAGLTNGLQERAFETSVRSDRGNQYFLPLLIATDNEGDLFPFTNLTNNFTPLPNNMTIGATWDKKRAEATGAIVGRELSAAGINMLLGPVVDVLDNPRSGGNGDIGIRSFGGHPVWVGSLARAYIRGMHTGSDGKILAVAKHFPGHGGSDRATDSEVPTVNKSLDQLRASELAPFAEVSREDAADAGGMADALMVSHIRYRNFVPGGGPPFTRPISIDAGALRTLMGLPEFSPWRADHLVMADALGVQAMKKWYAQEGESGFPNRSVVQEALLAGNDLLPLVEFYIDPAQRGWHDYQLPVMQDSILFMREQYTTNADFRRRADDAVRHVIEAKVRLYPTLARAEVFVDPARATATAGGGREEMEALANAALTLIQPRTVDELRARMPRGPIAPERIVIVECWEDCYPYRVKPKLDLQSALLRAYGPDGRNRVRAEDVGTISFGELDAWLSAPDDPSNAATRALVADASWLIFGLAEYNPVDRPASAALKRFLNSAPVDVRNKNLVAIAYNVPYQLDSTEISKLSAYFAVYNKTEPAIDAGFAALFGDATPAGHSPVNIAGIFYNVSDVTQPDPAQDIRLQIFGREGSEAPNVRDVGLVAGPIIDRNGSVVPDGTLVSFTLARDGGAATTATALTVDGLAGAALGTSGTGAYTATASVGAATSEPFALRVSADSVDPTESPAPDVSSGSSEGGGNALLLALAIGVPSAAAIAIGGGAGVLLYRRRRGGAAPVAAVAPPMADEAVAVLRVDAETRRVYIKGTEARPPLSNEQFRLLLHLYERAGKVVSREDLVQHVWPDAHADGVSEEALDALVRRVRERIVQAGGERSYIVTLRGQGFRLEV
jgi:beta-N-acetylhexosaminidase